MTTPPLLNLDSLHVLIECLEQTPRLSKPALKALRDKDRARQSGIFIRMMETGETYGQASGENAFLSLPEPDFLAHLRSIDNNLDEQVAIVSRDFSQYLEVGAIPAPHYPWRIAIILRRAKLPEVERRFLAAWCRHFGRVSTGLYSKLAERRKKLG